MSLLDAHIPQLIASHTAFAAKAGLMRHTIGQAEQQAMSAQAFHQESPRRRFRVRMPGLWPRPPRSIPCWISRKPIWVRPRARMWPPMPPPRPATPGFKKSLLGMKRGL